MGLCGMHTLSSYLVLNKHSLSRVNRFCLWPNYCFVRGLAPLAMRAQIYCRREPIERGCCTTA
jgi:hypothetical protein